MFTVPTAPLLLVVTVAASVTVYCLVQEVLEHIGDWYLRRKGLTRRDVERFKEERKTFRQQMNPPRRGIGVPALPIRVRAWLETRRRDRKR